MKGPWTTKRQLNVEGAERLITQHVNPCKVGKETGVEMPLKKLEAIILRCWSISF